MRNVLVGLTQQYDKLAFVEYLLSLRASALKWRGNPPTPWNQVTITSKNRKVFPLCGAVVDTFSLYPGDCHDQCAHWSRNDSIIFQAPICRLLTKADMRI